MASAEGLNFATLLASSVHDMKNNVGMMIHQLAQLSEELGERRELEIAGLQASQLNQSLIQLLAVYKLEQNLYALPEDEVYLDEFCEDFDAAHRTMLEAMEIEFAIDAGEQNLNWAFDPGLLQSVLATLLSNIFQLQQNQPIVSRVNLSVGTVTVEQHCHLAISLEDDGPGFAEDQRGRFEPQAKATDFVSGSSGLGLYFSHLVAVHHRQGSQQGFLQLGESDTLGGAKVTFYLP